MTIADDRLTTRRRIDHLEYLEDRLAGFNLRALMGAQSVFQLLDFATYQQLAFAASRLLPGTNLFVSRDDQSQVQERELHVALTGPGDEAGRVEFEFERSFADWKFDVDVKIRDADSGSTHSVLIDGAFLGTITVDAFGKGRLELSTSPSSGEFPFPAGIPDVNIGSRIQIGDILEGVVGGRDDSTDNTIRPGEVEIDLFGSSGARGDAKLEQEPEDGGLKTEFRVRIRDTAPGQSLGVFVNNLQVGQIVTDSDGRGELELSTDPNFDEQPFPPGFPQIGTGTVVRVGNLVNGTFNSLPDLGPNGRGTFCDQEEFQGGLAGVGGVRGGARFEVELEDGNFLEHKFRVHVREATPGETHEIRVAGIGIGVISIDDRGRGQVDFSNRMHDDRDLTLPDFFPDIDAGTIVEVGNILSGKLQDFSPGCSALSFATTASTRTGLMHDHGQAAPLGLVSGF